MAVFNGVGLLTILIDVLYQANETSGCLLRIFLPHSWLPWGVSRLRSWLQLPMVWGVHHSTPCFGKVPNTVLRFFGIWMMSSALHQKKCASCSCVRYVRCMPCSLTSSLGSHSETTIVSSKELRNRHTCNFKHARHASCSCCGLMYISEACASQDGH